MKLVEHFNDFLRDIVNLNDTRITLLESSIDALKTFVRDSDWGPTVQRFASQGSWAHKTIIRPVGDNPFDADLLVYVDPVDGWDAKDYLAELRRIFSESDRYHDKVKRSSHCVTIEYAGERRIDLAPVVVDRGGVPRFEVCNHPRNDFELSSPDAYTKWLIDRNGWAGSNQLRKVTRLIKYLRDVKTTFTCPSVLLTTLLGDRITVADLLNDADFCDVPTSLKIVFGRLDDWLQARPARPEVRNPVLSSEVFSNGWDDVKYANFRDKIHTYREWIDDAFSEGERDESVGKWRRVFGDDFAAGAVKKSAAEVSLSARQRIDESVGSGIGRAEDLVSLFIRFGKQALPPGFDRLPHKQRPRWRNGRLEFDVKVEATLHRSRGSVSIATIPADQIQSLPKGLHIRFSARTGRGTSLVEMSRDYEVHWRITNTDAEATRAGCLRGGFEPSDDRASRWESLAYRGVHSVEAFVVRRRDNALVAQSAPFYVVIE